MIFTFIIVTLIAFIKVIVGILPTVPAAPSAVVTAGAWVTDQIALVVSLLNMIFTPALLTAIIIVCVAMLNFEWIYHSVMWILRKIPMINIK